MNTCFKEELFTIDMFYLFLDAKIVIAKQLFI